MLENEFYSFVPNDLDLWPLDVYFALLVTLLVQCFVATIFEVSTAFLFPESRGGGGGQTDRQTDRRT